MRIRSRRAILLLFVCFLALFLILPHFHVYLVDLKRLVRNQGTTQNTKIPKSVEWINGEQRQDEIGKRFKDRIANVTRMCGLRGVDYKQNWENVIKTGKFTGNFAASYFHRYLTCLVIKAGSSTWNNFMWKLRAPGEAKKYGFWIKMVNSNNEAWARLSGEKRIELSKDENAVRLMNVRHPLARMISGWGDKFTKTVCYDMYFKRYPGMLDYPNKYGKWKGPKDGYFMEFADFARYVADYGTKSITNLDVHFRPMLSHCDPCRYPFNYITKLETFYTDAKWIAAKLNSSLDAITHENVINKSKDPAAVIKEHFSKVEPDVVERLLQFFKDDMETFGYTFNKTTLMAGGWEKEP
ncbi:unnamed protein product [Clavelina lepadiformis]|uniref:Carbohydrate sulfotransferase n=1 Tax=Clavelina lepadiformis TaxID=159417 RepID=A0ABP0EZY5_CLALP